MAVTNGYNPMPWGTLAWGDFPWDGVPYTDVDPSSGPTWAEDSVNSGIVWVDVDPNPANTVWS